MNKLLLDHWRRWWWLLALGATYALMLGWSLALPADSHSGFGKKTSGLTLFFEVWLKVQGNMFVMQIFCLSTFTGAIWLLFDLQRGVARVASILPLTARQIGRGWWLATVALPAIAYTMLFFAGAGIYYFSHANPVFPVARLGLASLLVLLWLGTTFNTYFTQFANQPGWGSNWLQTLLNLFTTGILIWMIFGFAFSLNAQNNPGKLVMFLLAGALMTVVGWLRSERFQLGRSRLAVPARADRRLTPLAPGVSPAVTGRGGISFLLRSQFPQTFLTCVAVAVWMPLAMRWQGAIKSWPEAFEMLGSMGAAFWLVIFLFVSPVFRQLRWLRTLPISAARLTATLFAITYLPFIAVGGLIVGFAVFAGGMPLALKIAENYLVTLGLASICLCFAVWLGVGVLTYLVFFVVWVGAGIPAHLAVFVAQAIHQPASHRPFPFGLDVPLAIGGVLLMFLLTCQMLRRSRRAYRVQTVVFNKDPWGAAR